MIKLSLLPPCAVLFLCMRFLKHPPFPCLPQHTNVLRGRAGGGVNPGWAEQGGWGFPDEEHPSAQALSCKQAPANGVCDGPGLAWACGAGGGPTWGAPSGAEPPPRPAAMAELTARTQSVTGIFACFVFKPAGSWNESRSRC